MRGRRSRLILLVFGVAAIVASVGLYLRQPKGDAPDFSLVDLEGKSFRLRDFRGRVVLLDFMATWCGPCRASMPGLKAIYAEYGGRIVVISISVDPAYDTEERLRDWVSGWEARWIHARDLSDPPVSRLYDVTGIPTYVLIDKKGDIRYRHVGLVSEETLSEEVASLLAG